MPGRIQKIKCTICSFNDKLNITINSNINDANFQKTFLGILKKDINKLQIESNIKISHTINEPDNHIFISDKI